MQRLLAMSGILVLVALTASPAQPPKTQGQPVGQGPTYVGTDLCIHCHIDYARLWASLDHSQAMLDEQFPPENRGCEACHGPGGDHVAGLRRDIIDWEALDSEAQSLICLKCHGPEITAEQWMPTIHAELTTCTNCHEVHRPVAEDWLLKAPQEALCGECHELEEEIEAGHHHPLFEGALSCEQCHAFHGSEHGELLVVPQEQLCADCHDEVAQPESHAEPNFRLEHGDEARADRERCMTCHDEQASCATCHAVPLPHPEDFALEHTEAANEHLTACLLCHEEDYCLMCHESIPKPAANGEAGAAEGEAEGGEAGEP